MAGTRKPVTVREQWRNMPPWAQRATIALGVVEIAATTLAAADLARRPRSLVRGPKIAWWPALTVQPFGPFAYLLLGRRR